MQLGVVLDDVRQQIADRHAMVHLVAAAVQVAVRLDLDARRAPAAGVQMEYTRRRRNHLWHQAQRRRKRSGRQREYPAPLAAHNNLPRESMQSILGDWCE